MKLRRPEKSQNGTVKRYLIIGVERIRNRTGYKSRDLTGSYERK